MSTAAGDMEPHAFLEYRAWLLGSCHAGCGACSSRLQSLSYHTVPPRRRAVGNTARGVEDADPREGTHLGGAAPKKQPEDLDGRRQAEPRGGSMKVPRPQRGAGLILRGKRIWETFHQAGTRPGLWLSFSLPPQGMPPQVAPRPGRPVPQQRAGTGQAELWAARLLFARQWD